MSTIAQASPSSLLIRPAITADSVALDRLAQLDSASVPAGDLLVAETDGALVAAYDPASGAAIADPFRHTAHVVELLALRGSLMRTA